MKAFRLLPIPLALVLTACTIDVRTGPTQRDSVSIARDSSEFLSVTLNMGAGNLNVGAGAGAGKFAEGDLIYNVEAWKPIVKYSTAAGHGLLGIDQPGAKRSHAGNLKYDWDLRLAENVPIDLTARFGAGEAQLDLGRLTLRRVEVTMGAGELRMDLRGAPQRSYDVRVRGGVGQATIRLPREVGVSAKAVGGIGEIRAPGLRKEGDHYVNEAYLRSKATIHLDIQGGIGQINLLQD
jgi:hypothetical protein